MKIITDKQEEKLTYIKSLGRRKSPINDWALKLKIGEKMFISREEWFAFGYAKKVSPYHILFQSTHYPRSRLKGLKFGGRSYKEGWVIERKK